MDLIDSKYIGLISFSLQKFKRVKTDLYNFRCPICGDSQKNKTKTRGYLYAIKNNTNFKCHNCGSSLSFNSFLKELDPMLHKQYMMEKFKEGYTGKNFVVEEPRFQFKTPEFKSKIDLPKASENSSASGYLQSRKLNPDKFYYAEKFKKWTNSLKQTFDNIKYDEPRIIIPMFYENALIGFQGRSLGINKIKYITIMLYEDVPKIYGLDDVKKDQTVYVTEGPFDSTFLSNAIALCGADGDISKWGICDPVWIYDNEPRNSEIHSRISKCIDRGEKVVIWPSSVKEKDINDLIINGYSKEQIIKIIENNIHCGLEAKLKFNTWKKI